MPVKVHLFALTHTFPNHKYIRKRDVASRAAETALRAPPDWKHAHLERSRQNPLTASLDELVKHYTDIS